MQYKQHGYRLEMTLRIVSSNFMGIYKYTKVWISDRWAMKTAFIWSVGYHLLSEVQNNGMSEEKIAFQFQVAVKIFKGAIGMVHKLL